VHAKFEMTLSTAIMSKNAPEDRTVCCHAHVWGLIAQNPRHLLIQHLLTSKEKGMRLL